MTILEPSRVSHAWLSPFAVKEPRVLQQMVVCFLMLFTLCLFTRQGFATEEKNEEVTAVALRHWPPQYLSDTTTGKPSGFAIEVMDEVAHLCRLQVRYADGLERTQTVDLSKQARVTVDVDRGDTPKSNAW